MPKQLKKQTAEHLVEVSLKISKSKLPLISDVLKAVMALAGGKVEAKLETTLEQKKSQKKPRAAKMNIKTVAAKQPARRGRPPAEKNPPASPETAALIRDLRTKAGLSQKGLAVKLKIGQNQISLLETCKQHLKPALAKKLGRLFKTSIPS
ncbi:MAG: helix-turn-helix domain-containing protein [Deltaproteobacteria bacterium]|nr:helix-turn-helix domain-containing protein [Deltaproteobacteria bacterium]